MNVEKAKKRIIKLVKKGANGFPQITIQYFGNTATVASEVHVSLLFETGQDAQQQILISKSDARHDETIQSTIVKIIERTGALTVFQEDEIQILTT